MICLRLKQAREEADLTQQEMANLLEVHINTISNYENGRVPNLGVINDWAELTGKTRQWLLYGDEATPDAESLRALIRDEVTASEERLLETLFRLLGHAEPATGTDDSE